MKTLKYLSPTSISIWLDDQEQFYLQYLSDNRPEKEVQTQPMSVGSAFDSRIKARLRHILFGDDEEAVYQEYFEANVEPVNRDFASVAGERCMDAYVNAGALQDLLVEMMAAQVSPKFEFFVEKDVGHSVSMEGSAVAPRLLGKPDAWFVSKHGAHVILDWKVNGYCSKGNKSPDKGYVMIRDGLGVSRGSGKAHKDAMVVPIDGIMVDCYFPMEVKNAGWARQLAIYAWLCGEPVGQQLVGYIDQLVCSDSGTRIRVAEHRSLISEKYQVELYQVACDIWDIVNSDWIFRDMTREQSQERCSHLDGVKAVRENPEVRKMYGQYREVRSGSE